MKNTVNKTLALLGLTLLALSSCGSDPIGSSFVSSSASSSLGPQGYEVEKVSNEGGSAFYQIFVSSFCDSNSDGVGDLNGIASKLDYLEDLGVSYLWLTPIHPSPSYHKYDVLDYYGIDSSFGTLDDFDNLVAKAKEHHIGIVMDMVFNHCSVQSDWYKSWEKDFGSTATGSHGSDFVWKRPTASSAPTGWFTDPVTGTWVEGRFSETMPEFNLDTTSVRDEFAKIMKFWLDRGVAGFRYDACTYYYYQSTEQNIDFMKWLVQTVQAYKPGTYQVGEAWVNDQASLNAYCGSGMHCFNFPTSEGTARGSIGYIEGYNGGGKRWTNSLPTVQSGIKAAGGIEPVYFVTNHDQDRWGGYFLSHKTYDFERKTTVSAYLLTPGTPFMYYGEEIAMRGVRGSEQTDAARRQAMLWGEGESKCQQPENFTYADQVTVGVKEALADSWSLINHYRKVLSIRNKYNSLFRNGTYTKVDAQNDNIMEFQIVDGTSTRYLITNIDTSVHDVNVANDLKILEDIPTSHIYSSLVGTSLTLEPFATVLLG
jgi:alpha-amylase